MGSVNDLIAEHEAHARMFEGSGKSLREAGLNAGAVEAAFRMAAEHRKWAEVLRTAMQEQRELRTAEALRKRGSV